jgi:AraC-like DNA-binding protein
MLCFIAHNYTDQITLELVSKSIGLHPTCTMNLLRKSLGTSLVHYVRRLRTSHAQQLLATSDEKIIDVALASGFNSLSRFNEVFKRACGCSPCEYRTRCRRADLN